MEKINLKENRFWVARDQNGSLWLHSELPKKCILTKQWISEAYLQLSSDSNFLSEVKWEDREPTEVEFNIKKK